MVFFFLLQDTAQENGNGTDSMGKIFPFNTLTLPMLRLLSTKAQGR